MKKLAILLIAVGSLLSGCVAYEVQGRDGGPRHADRGRDGDSGYMNRNRDRDGDGASDRRDRRPNDPRRD